MIDRSSGIGITLGNIIEDFPVTGRLDGCSMRVDTVVNRQVQYKARAKRAANEQDPLGYTTLSISYRQPKTSQVFYPNLKRISLWTQAPHCA